MSIMNQLTSEELSFILKSEKLKEIQRKIGIEKTQALFKEAEENFKDTYHHIKNFNNKFTEAFLAAGDAISNPLYFLWYIAGVFAISTFTILCYVFLPVTAIVGGVYLYSTYQEEKKVADKELNKFQHALIKLAVLDEVIKRQEQQLDETTKLERSKSQESVDDENHLPKNTFKKRMRSFNKELPKVRKSIGVGIGIASTIVCSTYCLGIVLGACGIAGASAVLLGPIGLGIALGVGVGIGIFAACKYYQGAKNRELVDKNNNKMEKDLNVKNEHVVELSNLLEKKAQPKKIKVLKTEIINPNKPAAKKVVPFKVKSSCRPVLFQKGNGSKLQPLLLRRPRFA